MPWHDLDNGQIAALNDLLDQALEVPPGERASWLQSLPMEHAALRPHLDALLSDASASSNAVSLESLPRLSAPTNGSTDTAIAPGSLVGPYRLVRELGHGGMGSVWLAERPDGLVKRQVALKLPHGAWLHSGLAERMVREREILASLEHPHIARLYDAGLTTDGQPYLALEYVEGVAIDTHCKGVNGRAATDLAGRLRLFLQVARAVAYAHGKLVLHRDLKPANILVTPDGHTRLLDFGIAKLLEDGEARETKLTEVSGRILTFDYASPEQILGEPLAVTSDVYALGVVLFELLTGERPYRLKRASRAALEDAIVSMDARRPSDVARGRDRKALRGDLDTIILRALKKRPAERYGTVDGLIDDIERYLSGRPVLARADSVWYRTQKFIQRNALGVSAAALVIVAILVGGVMALSQARRAQIEQRRAEAVKDFIVAMFERADPQANGGQALTATELVRQASREIVASDLDDAHARAEISRVLGTTLVRLRDIDGAERASIVALSEARERFPPDHIEVLRARLLRASVMRFRNQFDDLRSELDDLKPRLQRLADRYPEDYLASQSLQTALEIEAVHYDAAVASAKQTVAIAERHFGTTSRQYGAALRGLSQAYNFAGDAANSIEYARQSLARLREAYKRNDRHPQVIDSRVILARSLAANGQIDEALRQSEAAIADAISVWGANNSTVGFFTQQSVNFYLQAGQMQDALAAALRSFAILKVGAPRDSMTYVAGQHSIGKSLIAVGRAAEAMPIMAFVAERAGKLFGANHKNTFEARATHAFTVAESGDVSAARKLVLKCLEDLSAAPNALTHYPTMVLGQIERRAGNHQSAIAILQQSIGPGSTLKDPAQRGVVLTEIGLAEWALRRPVAAHDTLSRALETLKAGRRSATPVAAAAEIALAEIELAAGDDGTARQRANRVNEFWREFDPGHADAVRAAVRLRELQEAR